VEESPEVDPSEVYPPEVEDPEVDSAVDDPVDDPVDPVSEVDPVEVDSDVDPVEEVFPLLPEECELPLAELPLAELPLADEAELADEADECPLEEVVCLLPVVAAAGVSWQVEVTPPCEAKG